MHSAERHSQAQHIYQLILLRIFKNYFSLDILIFDYQFLKMWMLKVENLEERYQEEILPILPISRV